jgi:hypothetical protein
VISFCLIRGNCLPAYHLVCDILLSDTRKLPACKSSGFNLAWICPCGICGGQKWHWDRFFPEYFGFPLSVSFHRCSITWKSEKKKLIIFLFNFIIGLHNTH